MRRVTCGPRVPAGRPCSVTRPEGIEEMSIAFPTKLVSSVAFGGEDLTDIYCTTIGGDNRAEYGPGAGALFRLQLGIKGVPDYYSRVGL